MKAAFYVAPNQMEIHEYETPSPELGEVLVKIRATGICGSDLNMNLAKTGPDIAPSGHEIAGEIVDVGKGVSSENIGKKVAVDGIGTGKACFKCWYCRQGQYIHCPDKNTRSSGGFAEYVSKDLRGCFEISDSMNWEEAALVEPLAVSVHGARIGNLRGGETVAIVGSGTIGLTSITAAKELGAGQIFVSARHKQQEEMALKLGATAVSSSEENQLEELVLDHTNGRGADLTLETVGGSTSATLSQSMNVTRRQGRVVILGVFYGNQAIDWNGPVLKELTVQGSSCYGLVDGIHDYEASVEILSRPHVNLQEIVTHRFSLDDIQKGFEAAYDKKTGSLKVQILQN
ncbi:MAG: zinc-binding dehydrogenase [Dehalococcoidia bacterium]